MIVFFVMQFLIKEQSLAYGSQESHTGHLDFCKSGNRIRIKFQLMHLVPD